MKDKSKRNPRGNLTLHVSREHMTNQLFDSWLCDDRYRAIEFHDNHKKKDTRV